MTKTIELPTGIRKEEVLFSMYSDGWEMEMDTTLIFYNDGNIDLHCQTGEHHSKSIEKAKLILAGRGLKLRDENEEWIGPSGCYYRVEPVLDAKGRPVTKVKG